MEFTSSTTSGRFVFDRKKGFSSCGSYGKVYKGIDKNSSQFVAIKVLKNTHVSADEDLERINCHNVVKFVAKDKFVKQLTKAAKRSAIIPKKEMDVIIMEYCNGETLDDLMKMNILYRNGLPDHLFLLVLECLVNTLEALHNAKMIHRDITKYNIMSHTDIDGELMFKVIDFGFTKTLSHDEEMVTSCCGAAEFLPIDSFVEWILNDNTASSSVAYSYDVDVWMVGVTLFFAATGQYPFQPWQYIDRSESPNVQECHRVWGQMMEQKRDEVIWINQEFENGPFKHHKSMPENCNLSPALRLLIAPLLKGFLSRRTRGHNKYSINSFIEKARSILNMFCVKMYHLPAMKIEKLYVQEISWHELFSAFDCFSSSGNRQIFDEPTKSIFVYQSHVINRDENLNHILPAYSAMQRCVNPIIEPPTLIFTPLKVNVNNLKFIESIGPKYEIPATLESNDDMISFGDVLHKIYQSAAKEDEISLIDDLVIALREKCLMEWDITLDAIDKFYDSVTLMAKMCTSEPTQEWNELLKKSSLLLKLREGTRERLMGDKGIFNSWCSPLTVSPQRRQSILFLLHTYNTVYQRYYGKNAVDETDRIVDDETCLECVRKAMALYDEIELDIKTKRELLTKSMKRAIEVMVKLQENCMYVDKQENSRKEYIQTRIKNRRNGEGDAVRCLAGLFEVIHDSEVFKEELNKLDKALNKFRNG